MLNTLGDKTELMNIQSTRESLIRTFAIHHNRPKSRRHSDCLSVCWKYHLIILYHHHIITNGDDAFWSPSLTVGTHLINTLHIVSSLFMAKCTTACNYADLCSRMGRRTMMMLGKSYARLFFYLSPCLLVCIIKYLGHRSAFP